MENEKVEGLISSVNFDRSITVGKKPNPIWRDCKRKRRRKRRRQKLRYQTKTLLLKRVQRRHLQLLTLVLFFFLRILIEIRVLIFPVKRVFPTKGLSHCNHRPFL